MDEILASQFYKKQSLVTCLPSNCFESDGSSNSDDAIDGVSASVTRKKKKQNLGCVVVEKSEESESDDSESRWPRNCEVPSDVVIPSSSDNESPSASLDLTSDISTVDSSLQCSKKQGKPSCILNAKKVAPSKKICVSITDRYKSQRGQQKAISSLPVQPPPSSRRKLFSPNNSIPVKKKRTEHVRARRLLEAANKLNTASSVETGAYVETSTLGNLNERNSEPGRTATEVSKQSRVSMAPLATSSSVGEQASDKLSLGAADMPLSFSPKASGQRSLTPSTQHCSSAKQSQDLLVSRLKTISSPNNDENFVEMPSPGLSPILNPQSTPFSFGMNSSNITVKETLTNKENMKEYTSNKTSQSSQTTMLPKSALVSPSAQSHSTSSPSKSNLRLVPDSVCTDTRTNILKEVRSSNIIDDHIKSVPAGLVDMNQNEIKKDAAENIVLFDGFIVPSNLDSNISVAAILQNTEEIEGDLLATSDAFYSNLENITIEQPTKQSSKMLNNKETNSNQDCFTKKTTNIDGNNPDGSHDISHNESSLLDDDFPPSPLTESVTCTPSTSNRRRSDQNSKKVPPRSQPSYPAPAKGTRSSRRQHASGRQAEKPLENFSQVLPKGRVCPTSAPQQTTKNLGTRDGIGNGPAGELTLMKKKTSAVNVQMDFLTEKTTNIGGNTLDGSDEFNSHNESSLLNDNFPPSPLTESLSHTLSRISTKKSNQNTKKGNLCSQPSHPAPPKETRSSGRQLASERQTEKPLENCCPTEKTTNIVHNNLDESEEFMSLNESSLLNDDYPPSPLTEKLPSTPSRTSDKKRSDKNSKKGNRCSQPSHPPASKGTRSAAGQHVSETPAERPLQNSLQDPPLGDINFRYNPVERKSSRPISMACLANGFGRRGDAPAPKISTTITPALEPVALPSEESDSDDSDPGQGWRPGDLQQVIIPDAPGFVLPQEDQCPLDYFNYYFDNTILDLIVLETNNYTVQKTGKSMNVTKEELKAFLGILIFMGVCKLPAFSDYWAAETRIPQVADAMPKNRFHLIYANIHFHDNNIQGEDRLLKIRPLLNHMRLKCNALEQEKEISIDERMQRYKGTYAGNMRQYMPDKPSAKWGFKLFVMAGKAGLTYDFIPYCGSNTFENENLTSQEKALGVSAMSVISLCKKIHNPTTSTVTFDNYYTGLPLIIYLKKTMEIHSLGTIKRNRIPECPLTDPKTFLKRGRGAYESFVNKNAVTVIQWVDNKCVTLASSMVGVEPASTIQRYSKEEKKKVDIPCPQAVLTYNKTMGGVDLSDMIMALYAVPTRARRWYMPLFGYALELALANSWFLYRRDCQGRGVKQTVPDSKHFRLQVSVGLLASNQRSKGRPSLDSSLSKKKIVRPMVPRPATELRCDGLNHWPEMCVQKNRCRYCTKGYSRVKCTKCNMVLCFNGDKNCFVQFHLK